MATPVNIDELAQEMQSGFEIMVTFLHLESGSIVMIQEEIFRQAADEEPVEELEDWEQIEYRAAQDILLHPDHYIEFPDRDEINEYRMMERFCLSLEEGRARDRLLSAIRGKGAFSRFKDGVMSIGMNDEWQSFRTECYREFAKKWCEMNGIPYE
ncbi:UPF0158 family protein [Bacillus sp. KH172YL63]|uniref:UPF0158 family protein n=1 Tax=Bacillus sp. KH172YL63 TaxID=2709784 RepID=UPI0013E42A82|nr:UPF0158 family protein [Bacillus sp. KH172YL63]BCB04147.1 hypothetical protein KH172YL63_22800 [Bacillus sp. KH172YL63]